MDLKNGLKLIKVLSNIGSYVKYPDGEYWNHILQSSKERESVDADCVENEYCKKGRERECTCTVMDGFGSGIIDVVIEKLEGRAPHKIRESLCDITDPEWQRIGDTILAWCCGSNELRS